MKKIKGLSLFELLIAVVISVVITLGLMFFKHLTQKNPKLIDHITQSHGIDCSANATARKQCQQFGITNQ